ncbi:MAG: hypothetical protein U1E51_26915 [Candidatus Binatia bacterium]|nr:hypothetical protein [Candidatus Binatia bacterium]
MRTLASLTFALGVAAWFFYFYAWSHARPSYRAYWIFTSMLCTLLTGISAFALLVGMLLWL